MPIRPPMLALACLAVPMLAYAAKWEKVGDADERGLVPVSSYRYDASALHCALATSPTARDLVVRDVCSPPEAKK